MGWLSSTALRLFRLVVGLAALLVAAWLIGRDGKNSAAIWVALVVFGAFVIAHLLLDLFWARLWTRSNQRSSDANGNAAAGESATNGKDAEPGNAEVTKAFRDTTGVVISTSGVVLGLVAALSSHHSAALKAGVISLVAAILVAIVLYLYILYPLPEDTQPNVLVRYLLTIAFFAFAFGLLSIAMSIVFE